MSAFDAEEGKREIIIVRRGGGDHEEGHHGGVWKIAFADFMTALMCFFLVMWLVNATNEDTKAAIASYFNPMTLVDTAPASKGLDDPAKARHRRRARTTIRKNPPTSPPARATSGPARASTPIRSTSPPTARRRTSTCSPTPMRSSPK